MTQHCGSNDQRISNPEKQSEASQPARLDQQESDVTPTPLCKPLVCLWSLFEIFHIFHEGSAGRGILNTDTSSADLLANCFSRQHHPGLLCPGAPVAELDLCNISQAESCPGELPDRHSERSQTHLQLYNTTQSFKLALKAAVPQCDQPSFRLRHSEEVTEQVQS